MRLQLLGIASLAVGYVSPAAAQAWWDSGYGDRQIVEITTDANTPDKGYDGYTVRISGVDTASLVSTGEMRADCNDLRIVYWDGAANTDLPRHVLNCNSANTDIRFMMVANQEANSTSQDYFFYFNNSSAGAPTALSTTNVYLWYDDASSDRRSDYIYGRFDPWHGAKSDNSLAYDIAGYYTIDTGDNFNSGARRAVDERDVYLEVETFHTGCYPLNMNIGAVTRGIVTGNGGDETSTHYYATTRAEFPTGCDDVGYPTDGDIVEGSSAGTAVNGPDLGDIVANQWRRFALASWRVNPTFLSYYEEEDTGNWTALGYPSVANLHVTGTDAIDSEGRGEAGIVFSQAELRWRNMLIRRYIEPEPVLTLTPAPVLAKLEVTMTVSVFDLLGHGLYAIPGNDLIYTLTTRNIGEGPADADSIFLVGRVPNDVEFFNGDIDDGGPETNPLSYTQSAGAGLTFDYAADVAYSDDMSHPGSFSDCTYSPLAGYDAAVTYICINPKGVLAAGTPEPEFQVSFRSRIK